MKHQEVTSSTIRSIAHDGDTLEVKFHSGSTYRYSGVPADLHGEMMGASSAGKFLNENIKGRYAHEQV